MGISTSVINRPLIPLFTYLFNKCLLSIRPYFGERSWWAEYGSYVPRSYRPAGKVDMQSLMSTKGERNGRDRTL